MNIKYDPNAGFTSRSFNDDNSQSPLMLDKQRNRRGIVFDFEDSEFILSLEDIPRFLDQFQKLATELLPDEITGTDYLSTPAPAPAPSIDSKPRKSDIKETHSFMGKSGGRLVATIYKNGNVLTLHIENALGVVDFDAERLEQIIDILREKLNPAPGFLNIPYDYSLPPLPPNSAYKINGKNSAVLFIYPAPLAGRYDLYDSETETAPAGVRIELTGGGLSSRAEFTIEEARALVVGLAEVLNRLPDESGV